MNIQDIIKATPVLSSGANDEGSGKRCLMEAVAFVMGYEHSDSPPCTCPVIADFCRQANDNLLDGERHRLWEVFEHIVGTVSPKHEAARAEFFAMRAVNRWAVIACRGVVSDEIVSAMERASTLDAAAEAAAAAATAAVAAEVATYDPLIKPESFYAMRAAVWARRSSHPSWATGRAAAAAAIGAAMAVGHENFDLAQEYVDTIIASCNIGKEVKQSISPVRALEEA